MPYRDQNLLSKDVVSKYFNHLNPIAQKIAFDIRETRSSYGQVWYTLSANEQNDIINETLMKPEISLKYIGNLLTTPLSLSPNNSETNESQSSKDKTIRSSSTDSLLQILKRRSKGAPKPTQKNGNVSGMRDDDKYYAYDGRNLGSFAIQKVSLKILQDDVSSVSYHDEHSSPFSYRTKSQINFHMHPDNEKEDENTTSKIDINPISTTNTNYRDEKLDKEVLMNCKKMNDELLFCIKNSNQFKVDRKKQKPSAVEVAVIESKNKTKSRDEGHRFKPENSKSNVDSGFKTFGETTKIAPNRDLSYTIYSDAFMDQQSENANLMENFKSSTGLLTASSSSAATSDDDFDDGDKTLCEDVKLLDNDVTLRKGFDFLNNW